MSDGKPTLWQIGISHYSEKARWALAYKEVPHRRRSPLPGTHIPIALWLTRGEQRTFPVLQLDGETIGDSTAVIGAIEERYPDPPLYPADAELAANGGEYLAGDGFSVADLTAASLFYPLVGPAEGPVSPDSPTPPALESFRGGLSSRPGYLWVEEMFRRHRRPAQAGAVRASL
jgi:glutathione S-transferase